MYYKRKRNYTFFRKIKNIYQRLYPINFKKKYIKNLKILELVGDYKLIQFKPAVPFQTVSFLAKIAEVIANQGMNILIVSTFSKDYVMIKEKFCEKGLKTLKSAGFPIKYE